MKLKRIMLINVLSAFIAVISTLIVSEDFMSSILLVFFAQGAALIAIVKYFHTKNILKAAGEVELLKASVSTNTAILILVLSVFSFVASVIVFQPAFFYQIANLASASIAIFTITTLYLVMYPILVKFSAGIYKKMSG